VTAWVHRGSVQLPNATIADPTADFLRPGRAVGLHPLAATTRERPHDDGITCATYRTQVEVCSTAPCSSVSELSGGVLECNIFLEDAHEERHVALLILRDTVCRRWRLCDDGLACHVFSGLEQDSGLKEDSKLA